VIAQKINIPYLFKEVEGKSGDLIKLRFGLCIRLRLRIGVPLFVAVFLMDLRFSTLLTVVSPVGVHRKFEAFGERYSGVSIFLMKSLESLISEVLGDPILFSCSIKGYGVFLE